MKKNNKHYCDNQKMLGTAKYEAESFGSKPTVETCQKTPSERVPKSSWTIFKWIFTSNGSKMISIRLSHMFRILKSISAFRAFWKTNFQWGSTCQDNIALKKQHLLTKKSSFWHAKKMWIFSQQVLFFTDYVLLICRISLKLCFSQSPECGDAF